MTELMDVPMKPAQSDAPASEPTSWMNSNGDFGDGAPENVRTLLEKKKWTNINQLADGYTELEKFKGVASGKHIALPEDMNDQEAMSKIYNQLGRPETSDKYEYTNNTDIELSDELMSGFKEFAHKHNYTQSQLEGAIDFQLEAVKAGNEIFEQQQAAAREESVSAMKQKWQTEYEPTMTKINATAEKLQVKEYFEQLGIDKDPRIVNMLLTIANSDSEDAIDTTKGETPLATTLQDQLKEIVKSDAFTQRFHPDHKETMARYMELNTRIANAGQGKAPRS